MTFSKNKALTQTQEYLAIKADCDSSSIPREDDAKQYQALPPDRNDTQPQISDAEKAQSPHWDLKLPVALPSKPSKKKKSAAVGTATA